VPDLIFTCSSRDSERGIGAELMSSGLTFVWRARLRRGGKHRGQVAVINSRIAPFKSGDCCLKPLPRDAFDESKMVWLSVEVEGADSAR